MTIKEKVLNVLRDKEWHCAVCDLGGISSQHAATIRDLKRDGHKFETGTIFCSKCNRPTTHRKLK